MITTKLKPELVERINALCMHGSNVMLNSNMVLNLFAYVDHLEKLAALAAEGVASAQQVKDIESRIERANTAASIVNTSKAQRPPVPDVPVIPSLARVVEGQVQFIENLRYVFNPEERCIIAYMDTGAEFARHYVTPEEATMIVESGKPINYSMSCKLEVSP